MTNVLQYGEIHITWKLKPTADNMYRNNLLKKMYLTIYFQVIEINKKIIFINFQWTNSTCLSSDHIIDILSYFHFIYQCQINIDKKFHHFYRSDRIIFSFRAICWVMSNDGI